MSVAQATAGVVLVSVVLATGIDLVLPEPLSPEPTIKIADIRLYADEAVFYDRDTADGTWIAWSGQVFDEDGGLHCRGGDTNQYFDDGNPLWSKDIAWMIGESCLEGWREGLRYVFTWTPLDSDFAAVRFPEVGYGIVLPPRGEMK